MTPEAQKRATASQDAILTHLETLARIMQDIPADALVEHISIFGNDGKPLVKLNYESFLRMFGGVPVKRRKNWTRVTADSTYAEWYADVPETEKPKLYWCYPDYFAEEIVVLPFQPAEAATDA